MSPGTPSLEVRLSHRVHPGLTIEVAFRLRDECGILFGPSGVGKSTVLRLVAGLIRPQEGLVRLGESVLFDSDKGVDRPLRLRRIGLIFQDDLLFPHLSVERNVRFGLKGWPREESRARLSEVAALCGVGHLLDRDPASLSGGEKQRVGLARALAPRPKLLLCDEPVSALDLEARHGLIDRIRRVRRLESIPILYVTHSPDEAISLGDRLFLLEGGRLAAEGSPLDVLSSRGPRDSIRLRNIFEAGVEAHDFEGLSTTLRIVDGPSLIVPRVERPVGTSLNVCVRADEIVLSKGPPGTVSARNLIAGTVERVVRHGPEAEVIVRTVGVSWAVGVISAAIEPLGLIEGAELRMIIKSRSCQVLED